MAVPPAGTMMSFSPRPSAPSFEYRMSLSPSADGSRRRAPAASPNRMQVPRSS